MRNINSPRWLTVLAVAVLTTSACIDSSTLVEIPAFTPAESAAFDAMYTIPQIAEPSPAPSKIVETGELYAVRSGQFVSAQTGDLERGTLDCTKRAIRKQYPKECGNGGLIINNDNLTNNIFANTGTGGATINCEGSVDERSQGIGATGQVRVATNRGKACATQQIASLKAQAAATGIERRILSTDEARDDNISCSAAGVICVQGGASPHVVSACDAGRTAAQCEKTLKQHKEGCANQKAQGCVRGRATGIRVNFSVIEVRCPDGTKLAGQIIPADGKCDIDTTTTTTIGTTSTTVGTTSTTVGTTSTTVPPRSTACIPNPSRGVFCSTTTTTTTTVPGGGSPDINTDTPSTQGPVWTDTDSRCEIYPEDCLTVSALRDTVTVRMELSAPTTNVVGGVLREQEIRVERVDLYCGNAPCPNTVGIYLEDLEGRLDLVSSNNTKYPRCATPTSRNCAYYISNASAPSVTYTGRGFTGNLLRAGFISATPTGVTVRPTFNLSSATVALLEYDWVGGTGCGVDIPPRSCWEMRLGDAVDMRNRTNVVTTAGDATIRSGNSFYVNRRVIGTVGS